MIAIAWESTFRQPSDVDEEEEPELVHRERKQRHDQEAGPLGAEVALLRANVQCRFHQ